MTGQLSCQIRSLLSPVQRVDFGRICPAQVGGPSVAVAPPGPTATDEERAAFAAHAQWLGRLLTDGVLILAGPTLGPVNTGIGIFEAPDEQTAQRIIAEDPVARGGFARGELRPYQVGFLRGRG